MDISYNHIDIISHALCLANVILKNNYEEIKGKGYNEVDDAYESYIAEVQEAMSALQHIRKELHLKDDYAYNQKFGKSF